MTKKHKKHPPLPHDSTLAHAWIIEPPVATPQCTITPAGLESIANHKYKPGQNTHLDTFLNPMWTYLTNLLPMWLAPNMVTTLGGLHCGFAYGLLWYYAPNIDEVVPSWVVFLSGYCTLAYYTLDCMDGKQSRRTGTSSPLGQLFDHGFDCICNLAHCANTGGYLMIGGSVWYLVLQSSLQFSFFMAQWEEYYTHVLPHACGKWLGVTEVNYGLGIITMLNSFIDREAFWIRPVASICPDSIVSALPSYLMELELRYAGILGWAVMVSVLIILSFLRVCNHVKSNAVRLSALSKLLSPFLLASAPFLLPESVLKTNTRYISVATGLVFSLITKKMIVYSMAKMSFATLQLDVIPYVLLCLWIHFDGNFTERGANFMLALMCLWHTARLLRWASLTINQICKRLDINCFTIKKKNA